MQQICHQNENQIPKPRKTTIKFINRLHERREAFKAAKEWIGIFMTREEVEAWISDQNKQLFNDRKIWRCQSCDYARRNALTDKIETHTSLHYQDISINEYFVTTNNGIIMWARLDEVAVDMILRQTSKLSSKVFKAIPFIPDIARFRKKEIDAMGL